MKHPNQYSHSFAVFISTVLEYMCTYTITKSPPRLYQECYAMTLGLIAYCFVTAPYWIILIHVKWKLQGIEINVFLNKCVPVYLTKLPVSHVDQITSCYAFWKIFSHPRFFLSTISYNIIDYNSYMHDEIEMYAMQWNASDIGVGINTTF